MDSDLTEVTQHGGRLTQHEDGRYVGDDSANETNDAQLPVGSFDKSPVAIVNVEHEQQTTQRDSDHAYGDAEQRHGVAPRVACRSYRQAC